jgi:hypothetical protein
MEFGGHGSDVTVVGSGAFAEVSKVVRSAQIEG